MTPRHEVSEIIARHRYEPTLRTIYVEGTDDKILLEWLFSQENVTDVEILPIDLVNISNDLFIKYSKKGFPKKNNKGGVLILSFALSEAPDVISDNVFCLVDRDCDDIYDRIQKNEFIIYTDFADMEGYFLREEFLRKYFKLFLGKNLSKELFDSFIVVCSKIFFIRAVKEKNKIFVTFPSFKRWLNLEGQTMTLNVEGFIKSFLRSKGYSNKIDSFIRQVNQLDERYSFNREKFLHGKETIKVIRWLSMTLKVGNAFYHRDIVGPGLRASSETLKLKKFPLFIKIIQKYK